MTTPTQKLTQCGLCGEVADGHTHTFTTTNGGDKADQLLARCLDGFSAFVNGRKMARRERDKLRSDIEDYLQGRRILNPPAK